MELALRRCRELLESDKVTERKVKAALALEEGAEQLESLLNNSRCLDLLDNNSDQPENALALVWDDMFRAVCFYIDKEAGKQRKEEATGKTLKRPPVKLGSKLAQLIFQKACRCNKLRLTSSEVVNYFVRGLEDSFLKRLYGSELCQTLALVVLSKKDFWQSFSAKDWKRLCLLLLKMFRSPPPSVQQSTVLQLLRHVVERGTLQSNLTIFLVEESASFKEILTSALNIPLARTDAIELFLSYSKAAGTSFRASLCQMGNVIVPLLLDLWDEKDPHRLEKLIEIFQIHTNAHFPGGVATVEASEFDVAPLYVLLKNHLVVKNRMSQKECAIFYPLFADVLYQMLSLKRSVTLVETHSLLLWFDFVEGTLPQFSLWLEATSYLCERHQDLVQSLPFSRLMDLGNKSKWNTSSVLHLLSLYVRLECRQASEFNTVWDLALRLPGPSENFLLHLLTQILAKRGVSQEKAFHFFESLIRSVSQPKQEHLFFVATYLSYYKLPDTLSPDLQLSAHDLTVSHERTGLHDRLTGHLNSHVRVMDWVLKSAHCDVWKLAAVIICGLTAKEPEALLKDVLHQDKSFQIQETAIEGVLIDVTFQRKAEKLQNKAETETFPESSQPLMQYMSNRLGNMLIEMETSLTTVSQPNGELVTLVCKICRCISFASHFVQTFGSSNVNLETSVRKILTTLSGVLTRMLTQSLQSPRLLCAVIGLLADYHSYVYQPWRCFIALKDSLVCQLERMEDNRIGASSSFDENMRVPTQMDGEEKALNPEVLTSEERFMYECVRALCCYDATDADEVLFRIGERILSTKPTLLLPVLHISSCYASSPVTTVRSKVVDWVWRFSCDYGRNAEIACHLLDTLSRLCSEAQYYTPRLIEILDFWYNVCLEQNAGAAVQIKFWEILFLVYRVDTEGAMFMSKNGKPVSHLLINALAPGQLPLVSWHTAGFVGNLFASNTPTNIQHRLQIFDDIWRHFDLVEDCNPSRVPVAFRVLESVIVTCPEMQEKCISLAFVAARSSKIRSADFSRILQHIAMELEVCLQDYLAFHMGNLVQNWLQKKLPLSEFPFQVCGCDTFKVFVNRFCRLIAPEVVFYQPNQLPVLADTLNLSSQELVTEYYGSIMARLLPYFSDITVGELTKFSQVKSLLRACLPNQDEFALMPSAVSTILSELVGLTTGPVLVEKWTGCKSYATPQSFHLDETQFRQALESLSSRLGEENHRGALRYLSTFCSFGLHEFLTSLFKRVDQATRFYEKQTACAKLGLGIDYVTSALLADELKHPEYVVRFIVYHSCHLLKSESKVARFVLKILHSVCQNLLCKPHLLAEHLPFLIITLTSLATNPQVEGKEMAVGILKTFVVTQGQSFQAVLAKLHPFPSDDAQFDELNQALGHLHVATENSLQKEVEMFLAMQQSGVVSLESLRHLKHELSKWLAKQSNAVLHEGSELNIVGRVISGLLRLWNHKDRSVVEEASKILGQLGPINLGSLILDRIDAAQPKNSMQTLAHVEENIDLILEIVTRLVNLLFDSELDTCLLAGNVLQKLLSSKPGAKFFEEAVNNRWELLPYIEPFAAGTRESEIFDQVAEILMVESDVLWNMASANYQEWITKLTLELINAFRHEKNFFQILGPMCQLNVSMCETVLPRVVHTLLKLYPATYRPLLSLHFNRCFVFGSDKGQAEGVQAHLSTLLNVVCYLRTKTLPKEWPVEPLTKSPWDSNLWLALNYFDVARAALNISQSFMSILFAELQLDVLNPISKNLDGSLPEIRTSEVADLLFESYSAIGDKEGVQGFLSSRCHSAWGRHQLFRMDGLCDRAWVSADALATVLPEKHTIDLVSTLGSMKWNPAASHVVEQYYHETGEITPALRAMQYECAWRLGQWDFTPLPMDSDSNSPSMQSTNDLQPLLFAIIKSLQTNDTHLVPRLIRSTRETIMKAVGLTNLHCTRNIYPTLSQLRLVHELELVDELNKSRQITFTPQHLKSAWEETDQEAEFVEPILAVRCMAAKILCEQKKVEPEFLLEVIVNNLQVARKSTLIQPADMYLKVVENTKLPLDSKFGVPLRLEVARLTKLKNCGMDALNSIRHLQQFMQSQCPDHALFPFVLQLLGDWSHELGIEKPRTLLESCYQLAYEKARNISEQEAFKSCLALAKYADRCFVAAEEHMKSETYRTQIDLFDRRTADYAKIPPARQNTKSARYLKDTLAQDQVELKKWEEDRNLYLKTAVENYISGVTQSTQSEDLYRAVSRLVSLLLHNRNNEPILKHYYEAIRALPTYYFTHLVPQLAARLVTPQTKVRPSSYHLIFAKFVQEFLELCAHQHPHHTLPVLLAQQLSYEDQIYTGGAKPTEEEDRVKSARLLLKRLRTMPALSSLIESMENLYYALIEIANTKPPNRQTRQQFEPEFKLGKFLDCQEIALPTSNIPISREGKYRDYVGIRKFSRTYELVGGLNMPKRIFCQGTDGKVYSILVKGNDDLRQDSVMQQIFTTVNRCLQSCGETRKNNLRIRTYKVVPLSHRSGLIEWCEDTIPFGNYLIGADSRGGAHSRYYPKDLTLTECNQIMEDISREGDWSVKLGKFQHLCENFHPVFRHFFYENYCSAVEWFERRAAYTKSVAVASMAGYVVGLGDRHSQNILIDKKSAEVIHIDLGIAFDQGLLLNTPETVPFRLTRDVVDGMGFGTVNGAFMKYCQATMDVLQEHRDSIVTLVEVLIYDPLYVWRTGTKRIANSTSVKDEEVNASAQRALLRLQEKLQCIENETTLSVPGLVGVLVQRAMDPQMLVRIYKGWRPYL